MPPPMIRMSVNRCVVCLAPKRTRKRLGKTMLASGSTERVQWIFTCVDCTQTRREGERPFPVPRVAAADPPHALARPANRPILVDRSDKVLAAAGMKPAQRRQQRSQADL